MRKFGLAGNPISHSQSPALFKRIYGDRYSYELIEGDDFEASFRLFLKEFDGINVTAPFKTLAYEKADLRSPECEAARAANILVKTSGGIMAFNSDYSAVCLILLDLMKRHELRTALVIGCGGAGRAAAVAAMEMGLRTAIAARNTKKAEEFAENLATTFGKKRKPAVSGLDGSLEADVVIYALGVRIDNLDGIRAKVIIEANYMDPCLREMPSEEYVGGEVWLQKQAETGYGILTEQH